ncbi:hypothetical protein PCANC_25787 [Puccinia coronata f. sp. avenae]|uniref:Uncharacterized protein n=1 Tax=Puccinia coronata f. sp. avenae TaxID=200324 RepID=A0A2N5U4F0_9BASI|nr:hypothetical protein PCANC_26714 [Puccinia coronata f. sp. avenae]PLW32633.1 hypothetical protein PCANC_25787 [Puccinia coronata f. sp. avenae]
MSAGGSVSTPSPKTGRNFVKFGNKAEIAKPTDANTPKPFKAVNSHGVIGKDCWITPH